MSTQKNSLGEYQPDLNDLVALSNTLAELERLAETNPSSLFLPHPKQKLILEATTKEVWALGGNRSGKTEGMVASMAKQLTGQLPSRPLAPRRGGWHIYVCSQTKAKQREVIQEKILKYLPLTYIRSDKRGRPVIYQSKGVWDYIELVDPQLDDPMLIRKPKLSLHGCKMFFKSYEEGVMGFEGASVDAAYTDEEPPKPIYEAIKARLLDRKRCGNGWFANAMTPDPDSGLTWTYDEIVERDGEDPDRTLIYMSTYDNVANIGQEEIESLERQFGATTSKARIYGLHISREGLVLDKFRPQRFPNGNIIEDFKPDWRFFTPYEATDWGYKHPWHWGFYAVSKDGEYIKYAELHLALQTVPEMKAHVRRMRERFGYKQPMQTVGDPSMLRRESSGYSILDQLAQGTDTESDGTDRSEYDRGRNVWSGPEGTQVENRADARYIWYPVIVTPANNDRDEGWRLLNERMNFEPGKTRPSWYYTESCFMSIKEAKNLQYPPDKVENRVNKQKEISRKRNDDAPDCDRYASNANWVFVPDYDPTEDWLATESVVESDQLPNRRRKLQEDIDNDSITGW